ncbi:MAG: hypothetical protein WCH04_01060 [Gammaproteobacteria bacterium]
MSDVIEPAIHQVAATRKATMTSPNTPMVAVKITPSSMLGLY